MFVMLPMLFFWHMRIQRCPDGTYVIHLQACREDPRRQCRILQSFWHPELSIQLGQAWLLILANYF
uniref:Uncharacterized protein n=1 Tax=Aegilops tauschii subsp. strangulata TaxID=200361 RepID=A0A453SK13_AEGTS